MMADGDNIQDLYEFSDELIDERTKKRDQCSGCERPPFVCLCSHMPKEKVKLGKNIKIWIFQHPCEVRRPLRTTIILTKCLEKENLEILPSKIFSIETFPQLKDVYENEHTYVLYPRKDAINIEDLPDKLKDENLNDAIKLNIIILDGTWSQASSMFLHNIELQKLKKVILDVNTVSLYTIRTQPREFYLSTLETVALTLSKLEDRSEIFINLTKPLQALVDYQYEFGEVPHKSKEFLIINGLYDKEIAKWRQKKLIRNSKLQPQNSKDSIVHENT